jgi:acyl-coenzyme A thioesterase PaaI-like protein
MEELMLNGTLQPNSKMCFICGLENPVGLKLRIYEVEPGVVETMFTAPQHFQGYPGVLHGGIIATIIDEVSGRSWMRPEDNPRFMFTAKLEVKYRKNVPIGKPLRIVGKAGASKGRGAEAWAGIYDAASGELLAEGNTVLVNVPEQMLASAGDMEAMGWKVYPK